MQPKHFIESGTLWATAILTAIMGIDDSGVVDLLPEGAQDVWGYVIAFVAILMRLKTTGPVSIKKPQSPAVNSQ